MQNFKYRFDNYGIKRLIIKLKTLALYLLAVLFVRGEAATKVDINGVLFQQLNFDQVNNSFNLMGAEADITARITGKTRDIATGIIQLWAPISMQDWTMGFHFGQAYVLLPLGLRLPIIRIGQAVIPFGLLADYDTHTQIVQTTYSRTLGLRIDPGIGLQGQFGKTNYALWVSNGNGPYVMDNNKNKVVTARVAPKFLLGDAELSLGLSGLAGALPYWQLESMTQMMSGPHFYRMKYRAALDNTTDWGPATIHLEGVLGKDSVLSGPLVDGYYVEGRYAFISWLETLAEYDGYHVADQGSIHNVNAGFVFYPPNLTSIDLQVIFQRGWTKTENMKERFWNVTTQLTFRF
jgi:hypothetical protein